MKKPNTNRYTIVDGIPTILPVSTLPMAMRPSAFLEKLFEATKGFGAQPIYSPKKQDRSYE